MYTKWVNWVIPGLLAMTQLSIAAENNIIDDILPDDESVIEIEQAEPEQETIPDEELSSSDTDTDATDDDASSTMIDMPRIRFGRGYEYRQGLRPEVVERPEIPERPQIPARPELPELPGRFGR